MHDSMPEIVEQAAISPSDSAAGSLRGQHDLDDLTSRKGERRGVRQIREQSSNDFWNVNIPPDQHTVECPDFLKYAFGDDKDRSVLETPDSEYVRHTWDAVQRIIRGNRLDLFERVPSELRLYREYCAKLVRDYGSIMEFVTQERLHWADLKPSGPPFSNADDYMVLFNDWPYGVDQRVVHLVVWTKFELPDDPASEIGDMHPETRELVDGFVEKTFVSRCGRENVIWFRNWASLKSIHAVEHFHIMLFDPDVQFVKQITRDDVPLFRKVKPGERDADGGF